MNFILRYAPQIFLFIFRLKMRFCIQFTVFFFHWNIWTYGRSQTSIVRNKIFISKLYSLSLYVHMKSCLYILLSCILYIYKVYIFRLVFNSSAILPVKALVHIHIHLVAYVRVFSLSRCRRLVQIKPLTWNLESFRLPQSKLKYSVKASTAWAFSLIKEIAIGLPPLVYLSIPTRHVCTFVRQTNKVLKAKVSIWTTYSLQSYEAQMKLNAIIDSADRFINQIVYQNVLKWTWTNISGVKNVCISIFH